MDADSNTSCKSTHWACYPPGSVLLSLPALWGSTVRARDSWGIPGRLEAPFRSEWPSTEAFGPSIYIYIDVCIYLFVCLFIYATPRHTNRFHDFPTTTMLRALQLHCRGLGGKELLHADQAYGPKHQNSKKSKKSKKSKNPDKKSPTTLGIF